jgi:hypothetical protein
MSDEPDASDDDAEAEQSPEPTPIPEVDAVADQLASGEYELATSAVMDVLTDRLKNAEGEVDRSLALKEAGEAVSEIAAEADDARAVEDKVDSAASSVAQQTGTPTSEITDPLKAAGLLDQIDQQRETTVGEGIEVPVGIGLDSYLEEFLEVVVIQRSTDAVDDPKLRWRFSDGARVETSESAHHDYYQFYQKLNAATSKRLVPEVASEQVEEELRDDEDLDGEMYGKLSLGPTDRPWHTKNKLWSRAISGLVEERTETVTVTGRRTDAWETLQNRIATGRAVENLTDAVKHEAVYVDDDAAELWVPSSFVDKAAETVETTRRAMQAELSERGLTVADHGGGRVSESVIRDDTARRFWRFDLNAEAVPEPSEILPEFGEAGGDVLSAVGGDPGDAVGTTEDTSKSFGGRPAATDGGEEAAEESESTDGGDDEPDDDTDDSDGGEAA